MSSNRTAFHPVSPHPSSAFITRDASKSASSAMTFTWPVKDRAAASGLAFPGFPDIDPNAPEAEKKMFDIVNDTFLGGTLPLMGLRLTSILKHQGNQESRHEDFTFRNEPARIQVTYPQIVIHVGSEEKGTAGQLSFLNGRMTSASGEWMQNPLMRQHAMHHAGFAIGVNIARQNNMPFAVAALHGRLNAHLLLNEHNQYVGS